MMGAIGRFFGRLILDRNYCICRVCKRWTEISFLEGDICSFECLEKEGKHKVWEEYMTGEENGRNIKTN